MKALKNTTTLECGGQLFSATGANFTKRQAELFNQLDRFIADEVAQKEKELAEAKAKKLANPLLPDAVKYLCAKAAPLSILEPMR